MIITPKQPRNDKTISRLSKLVPYMLRGRGRERCTWYMAGNLSGLDRREDAELAVGGDGVAPRRQCEGQAKQDLPPRHLVSPTGPAPDPCGARAHRSSHDAGSGPGATSIHRGSPQRAGTRASSRRPVNKIHPETLKIHHPYQSHPCVSGACEHPRRRARAAQSRPNERSLAQPSSKGLRGASGPREFF